MKYMLVRAGIPHEKKRSAAPSLHVGALSQATLKLGCLCAYAAGGVFGNLVKRVRHRRHLRKQRLKLRSTYSASEAFLLNRKRMSESSLFTRFLLVGVFSLL